MATKSKNINKVWIILSLIGMIVFGIFLVQTGYYFGCDPAVALGYQGSCSMNLLFLNLRILDAVSLVQTIGLAILEIILLVVFVINLVAINKKDAKK